MNVNSKSTWLKMSILSLLQRFSSTIFSLLNFMLLVRHLSKNQIGIWALFMIIITTFELSKSSLLKAAHIRLVASSIQIEHKRKISWSSLLINGCVSLLFIIVLVLFSKFISKWLNSGEELANILLFYIPGIIIMVFYTHYEAVLNSYLDFKGLFYGNFIKQLGFTIPIFYHVVIKTPLTLTSMVMYFMLSLALGALMLFKLSYKHLSFSFSFSLEWSRKIINFGKFVLGSSIVSNIFSNLDQILTSKFLNPISVSYYNTASRISSFVDIPSYAIADVAFPKISEYSSGENPEKISHMFEETTAILLAVIYPTIIIAFLCSKIIIITIAGTGFENAVHILQIYLICSMFGIFQNQSANTLNAIGKAKVTFLMNSIILLIKFFVIFLFLKYFGFYGAAWGTLVITILNTIMWYFVMKKYIPIKLPKIYNKIIEYYKMVYLKSTLKISPLFINRK